MAKKKTKFILLGFPSISQKMKETEFHEMPMICDVSMSIRLPGCDDELTLVHIIDEFDKNHSQTRKVYVRKNIKKHADHQIFRAHSDDEGFYFFYQTVRQKIIRQ